MDQGKKMSVKAIAMMLIITVLVLGMFVEQTEAIGFRSCYEQCMRSCDRSKSVRECSDYCVGECHDVATVTAKDFQYYCRVGCASSLCTLISTPQDHRAYEVEGCVNSCSNKCIKQY